MKRLVIAFASGLIFAIGLGISGMTDPNKVIGFLNVFGEWDPALAFVMGGAMVPNIFLFAKILKRDRPIFDTRFHLTERTAITPALVGGSALFGIGWGLSGYCPGPAVVASVAGGAGLLAFTAAMLGGAFLYRWVTRIRVEVTPLPAAE